MKVSKNLVITYWQNLKEIGFEEYSTLTPFEHEGKVYKNLQRKTSEGVFYLRIDAGVVDFWFKANRGGFVEPNHKIEE
jgi:hypothetical protein